MPSIVARGQITILDYSDAVSLNAYIGSNQPLTQIYTPDTQGYTPDWTSGGYLKLTPQLFKSGSVTDLMTAGVGMTSSSVVWTSNGVDVPVDANHVKNASAPWDLTIKTNELSSQSQKNYECSISWLDPNTGLTITVKSAITFTKVVNPGSLITAISYAPNGTVYKNGTIANLLCHCDLWRGASIDTTNVSYQWFKAMSGVVPPITTTSATTVGGNTVNLTSVDGMAVGGEIKVGTESTKTISAINIGSKLVTINGTFSAVQASGSSAVDPRYDSKAGTGWSLVDATHTYTGCSGYTSNELSVPDSAVLNYETFKCVITDTDAASPTHDQWVSDIISLADMSDPILVDIEASNGTILRQGTGSTTITANLWQAGVKIDTLGTAYTYSWNRYNENGTQDVSWGTAGVKTGKSITITDPDVTGKATFYVYIQTLS